MTGGESGFGRTLSITELGNAILACLDCPEDLFNARLTCIRLNQLVTPTIYRSLNLSFAKEELVCTLKFIDFLYARPEYLELVQALSVTFGSKAFTHSSLRRQTKEYRFRCVTVIALLQNVPCLRNFR